MANNAITLKAQDRTEFGKGSARQARRAGQVPAVVYGHGTDPQHLNLPARDFAAILRNNGTNAVIDLDIEGTGLEKEFEGRRRGGVDKRASVGA